MTRYFLRRMATAGICLLGVSLIIFVAVRLSGDVAELLLPIDATPADFALLRAELGLDRPIPEQYVVFLQKAATGDFGTSTRFKRPALELIGGRLAATLELASLAIILAVSMGVTAGVLAAQYRGSAIDIASRGASALGQAVPSFWLGLMLMLVFAVQLGLLPTSGRGTFSHLLLPALTLAVNPMASISRLTRSAMLNVMNEDYIRLARLKGCAERRVIWKHALKNASIPIATLGGLKVAHIIGHTVIVEKVFAWPGLGQLIVDAVFARDYAVVQGGVLVLSAIYIAINLLVDLFYGVLDPRIRYV